MSRYIRFGEAWLKSELEEPGTVIERPVQSWGYAGQVSCPTPCCRRGKRLTVATVTYLQNLPDRKGTQVRCPGCGKKWFIRLIDRKTRELLPDKPHSTDVFSLWERCLHQLVVQDRSG